MNSPIIGWDVGGAHLKASLLDARGQLQQVLQVPCALWRGLPELDVAIDIVLNAFSETTAHHAITMTGELVDLFQSRKEGVLSICAVMDAKLNGKKLFYAGTLTADFSAFVSLQDVNQYWSQIASANWLASASFTGKQLQMLEKTLISPVIQHGLLIDIGSTTSDFVLLENNRPSCAGYTDALRMQSEELVYTGAIRTPLMAVTQKIQFNNTLTSIAAEHFATTADVYRLTGDLPEADDMADTADGQEKTPLASARRIARMIGHDVEDADISAWMALAQAFKSQQIMQLSQAARHHIARLKSESFSFGAVAHGSVGTISVVGAGVGAFLVKEIAASLNLQYLDVAQLIDINRHNADEPCTTVFSETRRLAGVCLPAYAVAYLAHHQFNKTSNFK